jgi:mediator of RNA polymerase II transcription subunit 14
MGLIPPEPMSSERALRLLKYMNTSLSIRLTVHENLPRHLKKWRVASGRVTFTIDSEFEMDLMTFSEDTSEPWLFIDLRLLLTGAPVIAVNARFLGQLKPKLDEILRDHGISGCFDFLHNFVLTHKIAVLRSQAYQLARGEWMGSIRVEPVHRSLVVQYWTERPGKKSWIEFGISSGKSKNAKASWRGPALSTLAVRWFRHGVEMKDADLQMDFKNLSMEQILKMVVALHVKHYLQTTRDTLSSKLVVKMILSELEPRDCTLEVSLGRPEIKTKLSLEPVTGRYILQPCTAMSARAEQNVNAHKDPLSIMGGSITYSLALTLQDRIQRHALQLSWQIQTKHIRADAVKQITGLDVLQFTIFYPSGWTTKWGLAAIIDASGETWWNLELGGMGTTIMYAEQVKMEKNGPRPPINRATLSSLERLALQQLCFCVTKRELDRQGISGSAKVELGTPSATSTSTLRGWVMLMRTSDLLKSKFGDGMWLEDRVRLVFSGFSVERREVLHIATATMVKSAVADMQKLMSASGQSNFTFSDDGEFSILLKTKFGEHVVDELKARLRDIDRLRAFTTTLQKRKMVLRAASMQQVKFQYGTRSIATVNFSDDQNITVSFDPRNAHNRILKPLVEIINERPPFKESPMPTIGKGSTGLDRFCTTLILTRPMVASLSEIENATPGNSHNPSVHTHSIGHYTIAYTNPVCSFEVHLRSKDDKIFWHIEDNDLKNADSRPGVERNPNHRRLETLKTSMLAFFKRRGERWFGVRTGILAELDGIQNALKELHQTVTSCSVPEGAPTSATAPSTAAATVGHNSNAGANAPPPNRNHRNSVGQRHPNNKQPPTGPDNKLNFPNLGRQGPQIGGNKPGHKQVKNGEPHEVIELD